MIDCIKELFKDIAAERGWTPVTQVEVLLDVFDAIESIDEKMNVQEFKGYLDDIVKFENIETSDFNSLTSREKWDTWKEQKGTWHCRACGEEMSDGPHSAGPFRGTTVHCGNCDAELTRRHGGGQNEPFSWVLKEN